MASQKDAFSYLVAGEHRPCLTKHSAVLANRKRQRIAPRILRRLFRLGLWRRATAAAALPLLLLLLQHPTHRLLLVVVVRVGVVVCALRLGLGRCVGDKETCARRKRS